MLLERERELEGLCGAVQAAREQRGAVVIVEGEAGIGKTSLLEDAAARAAAEGARVLRARGTSLEREFGFGIVRQLFERPVLHASEDERDASLVGAAALAAPAIGLALPEGQPAVADAGFAAQHGLYWLACNLAEQTPLLLLIDDAQWSDISSLRWIAYLAHRLDGVALAVLIGWRTGEPDAPEEMLEALRAEPITTTLAPDPLSDRATAAIVRDTLGADADARFCTTCHETTGGNPFLMQALVDALRGGEIAPTADATRRVQRLGPDAVRRYVLLRLSRLGNDAAALAQAVSILDTDAEPRFVGALAGLEPAAATQAAAALEGAHILEAGEAFRFVHPILRAAVYEDLPGAARAAEHRRAAKVLIAHGGDADRAAVHLLATAPGGDPWVVARLQEAAERARVRGAPETGLSLLERALAEPPPSELLPALLLSAGRLARIITRPQSKEYLAAAHRAASDPALRSEAASELARVIWYARPDEAADVLRRAIAEMPPDDRTGADRLKLELLMIETSVQARATDAILDELRDLHAGAPARSPTRLGAACVLLWHMELWDDGWADGVSIGELAQEVSDVQPLIDAYGADFLPMVWAGAVLADFDHVEASNQMLAAVVANAQRSSNAFSFNLAVGTRDITLALSGSFADAEAEARTALHIATLTGSWTGRRGALIPLIWALTGRGQYEEIEATLAAHGLESRAGAVVGVDANFRLARGYLRYRQGRHQEACADINEILRIWPARSRNPVSRVYHWAPRILAAGGQQELAEEIAQQGIAAARDRGLNDALGIFLHSAGLMGAGGRSIELLTEAAELLARSPWRWEHAETLVDLGAARRRSNQRTAARAPLSRGLELAEQLGAARLAERAREELIATGARPRRVVRTGVDSLTASERRVATAAAEGESISEIAQALFVTKKTVETHLYAAYRKLDVNSRDGLAAALAPARHGAGAPPGTDGEHEPSAASDGTTMLAAVLFTDIVDSTRHAAQLDDRRWHQLLHRHNQLVREQLAAHHGREIKTIGDGFMATFDSPASAVRCACAIRRLTPSLGIQIRAAVHAGEVQAVDGDVLGMTVNVAARILAHAGPGDILLSSTVRDLATGSVLHLSDRGRHRLKGVPGSWHLLAADDHVS